MEKKRHDSLVKKMNEDIPKFQKAGAIRVIPEVLERARKFADVVSAKQPGSWVICFSWYSSMSITDPKTDTTTHYGPGLNIGVLPASEVPEEATCEADGFRYAIQIPDKVVQSAVQKIIELNSAPPPLVRLL
jgi:hypothetical protein